jgi:Sigma-70, region 4
MLLHAEIGRLPEQFRAAVVLCYLEGRTYEDAARVLHCPVGTIKSRLATARERLRRRLDHLTLAPSVGSAELVLRADPQILPTSLPDSILQAVIRHATGGLVPASISRLAQGVLSKMGWHRLIHRLGAVGVVLICTAALATGTIGLTRMNDDLPTNDDADLDVVTASTAQPLIRRVTIVDRNGKLPLATASPSR